MQKTTVNPNPEQEMTVNPFAQEQAAEIQPQENAQTYPVEVDGDIVELTLEELIDAAAQGLSKRNAYIRRNRAANAMPNGQIYATFVEEYPDVRPEDIPQQVWEWAQQEGSLVSAYRKWEIAELRDELAALEMNQKNRRAAVGPGTRGGRPGYARFARQVTFAELKMENGKWKITAFILHYQLSIFHYCTIEHLYRR